MGHAVMFTIKNQKQKQLKFFTNFKIYRERQFYAFYN